MTLQIIRRRLESVPKLSSEGEEYLREPRQGAKSAVCPLRHISDEQRGRRPRKYSAAPTRDLGPVLIPGCSKGQSLVESLLLIPVIMVIIVMIFWFSRLLLTRQQLLMAARYGTDMIVYTDMDENQIRQEIREYLCGDSVEGRRLEAEKLRDDMIRIRIFREPRLDNLNTFARMYGYNEVQNNSSWVEIFYEIKSPGLYAAWGRHMPGGKLPGKFTVSARSEVLAGTGCKGCN